MGPISFSSRNELFCCSGQPASSRWKDWDCPRKCPTTAIKASGKQKTKTTLRASERSSNNSFLKTLTIPRISVLPRPAHSALRKADVPFQEAQSKLEEYCLQGD